VGIDIGASRTKGVVSENSKILALYSLRNTDVSEPAKSVLKNILQAVNRKSRDVKIVAVSGGGARLVHDKLLELPVTRVDEIKAIGFGGLELSRKRQALIVNMSTGTALVAASDNGARIEHIGGTGVGGGTILGLSRRMLGTDNFIEIEEMANRGNASKVNLTVADISGGPVGIVPEDATASNFEKLRCDTDKNDIAAAIFDMVSETVGVITVMAARATHLERDVVLVGKLIESKKIAERVRITTKMFQIKTIIPTNGEYSVAIGAVKSII